MRIFEEPNLGNNWKCPVCGTDNKEKVVLIGVSGTEKGNNMRAEQIHLNCINLLYDENLDIIYQKIY